MDVKEFKRCYLRWSYAVAFAVPTLMMAIVLCDSKLGFDFSRNMYMMSFIACGCVLSLLSLTWISILNLESRFMGKDRQSVIDGSDETQEEESGAEKGS